LMQGKPDLSYLIKNAELFAPRVFFDCLFNRVLEEGNGLKIFERSFAGKDARGFRTHSRQEFPLLLHEKPLHPHLSQLIARRRPGSKPALPIRLKQPGNPLAEFLGLLGLAEKGNQINGLFGKDPDLLGASRGFYWPEHGKFFEFVFVAMVD
ncbi:MAG: hypothetical protein PHD57_10185, partial [Desulfobacterales bacterium]|nr:hypothetical protein [Desulfobacterales bacterium]